MTSGWQGEHSISFIRRYTVQTPDFVDGEKLGGGVAVERLKQPGAPTNLHIFLPACSLRFIAWPHHLVAVFAIGVRYICLVVCDHRARLSRGHRNISTDTDCAGCRWTEIPRFHRLCRVRVTRPDPRDLKPPGTDLTRPVRFQTPLDPTPLDPRGV